MRENDTFVMGMCVGLALGMSIMVVIDAYAPSPLKNKVLRYRRALIEVSNLNNAGKKINAVSELDNQIILHIPQEGQDAEYFVVINEDEKIKPQIRLPRDLLPRFSEEEK